jgi:hypothetical protein
METHQEKSKYSIFFPILFLAIGALLLINNLSENPYRTGSLLLSLWPLLFIAGGLDSIYKREGLAGSLLFIGVGTIILLSNLGYSNLGNWHFLLRYWPLIIIAIGLDIIFPLRSQLISLAGLALGIVLIAGIIYLVGNRMIDSGNATNVEQINVKAEDIKNANVDLQMNAGTMIIGTDTDPANMLEATMNLYNMDRVYQNQQIREDTGYFSMKSSGMQLVGFDENDFSFGDDSWDIQLNPLFSTRLENLLIAGEMTSDITAMQQLDMENTVIFGKSIVILPEEGAVDVVSSVIFGELEIAVPKEANLMILVDTALDDIDLPEGFKKNGSKIYSPKYDAAGDPVTIKVSVPFGSIDILPQ